MINGKTYTAEDFGYNERKTPQPFKIDKLVVRDLTAFQKNNNDNNSRRPENTIVSTMERVYDYGNNKTDNRTWNKLSTIREKTEEEY